MDHHAMLTEAPQGASDHCWAIQPRDQGTLQQGACMDKLRADREEHSHRQIWTKLPHDGPYRKANGSKGYDPVLELPDSRRRQVELGYERVKAGRTTNFVGNHMTQGAIDLVQAELEQPATGHALLLPFDDGRGQRRLLTGGLAGPAVSAAALRYTWQDASSHVVAEVQLEQPAAEQVDVRCTFAPGSVVLELSPGGQAGSKSVHALQLSHEILPARCSCQPQASACTDSKSSPSPAAGEAVADDASQAAPDQRQAVTLHISLPGPCCSLVLWLAKACRSQEWTTLLQPSTAVVPAGGVSTGRRKGPDVAALRRSLRQQLGRAGVGAAQQAAGAALPED